MKTEVRLRGVVPSTSLREHVVHRVRCHLGRFGEDISGVLVRIVDINGPRGGIDKLCQITVRGPRLGFAIREDLSDSALSAVNLAAGRVSYAVGRELERLRRRHQRAPFWRRAS